MNRDKMLDLIYPERRQISVREVIAWSKDRMIDNRIETEAAQARAEGRKLTDEEIDTIAHSVDTPTLAEAIERLEDDGVATFRNRSY